MPLDWSPRAEFIWNKAESLEGSLAAIYLALRNCAMPESEDLTFLPAKDDRSWPTMCARITDAVTGKPISLHFTFLQRDGRGKAPIAPQKTLLKGHRKAGGVIRLVNNAEVTHGLGLCEGIETGLSILRSGWGPIWACGDTGNLAAFLVLHGIDALTIFADNDESGRGLQAANACADRWRGAGREARIIMPRTVSTDWNDIMRGVQA
jgi:phage/plasmid primase-like uncharacterized protein